MASEEYKVLVDDTWFIVYNLWITFRFSRPLYNKCYMTSYNYVHVHFCFWGVLSNKFLLTFDSILGGLYQVDVLSGNMFALKVSKQTKPTAIAFDPVTQLLFWCHKNNLIYRFSLTSNNTNDMLSFSLPAGNWSAW